MIHTVKIQGGFRPLQDWVVLKPIKEPAKTKGGILLPEASRQYGRCEVMAVGPGYYPQTNGVYGRALIKTELKPGQFVFIQKFVDGECRFQLNGESCFLIRERHCNCTIE